MPWRYALGTLGLERRADCFHVQILMQAFARNGLGYVRLENSGKKENVVNQFISNPNIAAFFLVRPCPRSPTMLPLTTRCASTAHQVPVGRAKSHVRAVRLPRRTSSAPESRASSRREGGSHRPGTRDPFLLPRQRANLPSLQSKEVHLAPSTPFLNKYLRFQLSDSRLPVLRLGHGRPTPR